MLNCTPHEIKIYSYNDVVQNDKLRKLFLVNNAKPYITIPPSGNVLNLKIEYVQDTTFEFMGKHIPIYRTVVTGADEPPEDNIVIVSALYASYASLIWPDKSDRLYTICQPVYESLGLSRYRPRARARM